MINHDLLELAEAVLQACREAKLKVATVESCTGGLLAAAMTAIPGSSDVVERGLVTYTDKAKVELAGVPMALFDTHGAVSEPVARAMAEGGLARSGADIAVGITGVAGPGGGTSTKPVGLVYIAAARTGGAIALRRSIFEGDRTAIREASVMLALEIIRDLSDWREENG